MNDDALHRLIERFKKKYPKTKRRKIEIQLSSLPNSLAFLSLSLSLSLSPSLSLGFAILVWRRALAAASSSLLLDYYSIDNGCILLL